MVNRVPAYSTVGRTVVCPTCKRPAMSAIPKQQGSTIRGPRSSAWVMIDCPKCVVKKLVPGDEELELVPAT